MSPVERPLQIVEHLVADQEEGAQARGPCRQVVDTHPDGGELPSQSDGESQADSDVGAGPASSDGGSDDEEAVSDALTLLRALRRLAREQKEDTKPVLSTGRAIFLVVMQFIAGFGLWFILTQLFYLASSPLPYYAKQVMIGGDTERTEMLIYHD